MSGPADSTESTRASLGDGSSVAICSGGLRRSTASCLPSSRAATMSFRMGSSSVSGKARSSSHNPNATTCDRAGGERLATSTRDAARSATEAAVLNASCGMALRDREVKAARKLSVIFFLTPTGTALLPHQPLQPLPTLILHSPILTGHTNKRTNSTHVHQTYSQLRRDP